MIINILLILTLIGSLIFFYSLLNGFSAFLKVIFSLFGSIFYSVSLLPLSFFAGIKLYYLYLFSIVIILYWLYHKKTINKVLVLDLFKIKNFILLFIVVFSSYQYFRNDPTWGDWDAWAIWNLKAKFLSDETNWKNMFSIGIKYSHLEYPLILPSIIATIWNLIGDTNIYTPMLISYFIFISIITISFYSLDSIIFSIFFSSLLFMDSGFISQASQQYADTLLGLTFLISVMLLVNYIKYKNINHLFVLGFFISASIFIKNDGWIFFILMLIASIYYAYNKARHLKILFLSCSFFLFLALILKLISPDPNDLFDDSFKNIISRLFEFNRYTLIINHILLRFFVNFQMLFLLGLLIISILPLKSFLIPYLILIFTAVGYFFIYLITPHDLQWHLSTSALRLMYQLYPSFLYLFFKSIQNKSSDNLSKYKNPRI